VNRHHKNNEEEYTEKLWKEIHVGDIIKITNNQVKYMKESQANHF